MHITANIFDNFYPFIVIIFFIISILSSIMKKKMKDSAQQNKTNYNTTTEEEYEIRHEEQEKPQYDYYKTTSGSYNVENVLSKLQDKISNIEKQKQQQLHQKVSKRKHVERTPLKPIETAEPATTTEANLIQSEMSETKPELKGFDKINDLPFLQKAIILSEVFGKPKGLD